MEPLNILYKGKNFDKIPLGVLMASTDSKMDVHEFSLTLENTSELNDLEDFEVISNMSAGEHFNIELPTKIAKKSSAEVTLKLTASKLLTARMDNIYIGFKYNEVRRY